EVATRLKRSAGTIADSFPSATVLFADIVGFTKLAASCPGDELVGLLNQIFSAFDRIAARYDLEKIKTIGDAYMVVGGVPRPVPDHAERVVRMAMEMIDAVAKTTGPHGPIQVRIGIHTGPVVAGVIGEQKIAYDLWGDTVNLASRLESYGIPGMIQISEMTAELLPSTIGVERRGIVDIKGKGGISTLFVRHDVEKITDDDVNSAA